MMSTEQRTQAVIGEKMKLFNKVGVSLDRTLDVMAALGMGMVGFSLLSINFDVFARKLLKLPQPWVTEISEYILLYMTFLGAAWLLRREGHVSMRDLLVVRLSRRVQRWIGVITSILAGVCSLITVLYGTQVTWKYYESHIHMYKALDTPHWVILIIIPIGSLMLSAQFARRVYGYLRNSET